MGRILIFSLALGMMVLSGPTQYCAAGDSVGGNSFALGNEAYVKGAYDQAISHYHAALDQEGYTSSILYNLGNAYYMKKEIGKSILNYERALYLDPENADIKANLALARKNFGLANPDQPYWKALFTRLSINGWTWMAVIAFCALSLMMLLNGIRPRLLKRPLLKMAVYICFLVFMGAGAGVAVQYGNLDRGVVTAKNAQLRVSPFDSAEPSGVVKDGKVVNLADTYQGYIFVKMTNGTSGWLRKDAVTAVLPKNGKHTTRKSLSLSGISGSKEA
jgi:hypothetical protein